MYECVCVRACVCGNFYIFSVFKERLLKQAQSQAPSKERATSHVRRDDIKRQMALVRACSVPLGCQISNSSIIDAYFC